MASDGAPQLRSILYVTRKWPPAVGGMETYSAELTKALARHAEVEAIALPGRADGSPPGALALLAFSFRVAWRYLRLKRTPDVLHIGDMACWPLALVAWTRRKRPTLVLSAHGTDVGYPRRGGARGRLYGAYLRLGARLLGKAKVIANSAATARAAAETGWRTEAVVPLATQAPDLGPPEGHDGHLLFAGRLVERKGCAWFVRNVLPLLPPGIGLKVAGTMWDADEAAVLEDPRVTYLGTLRGEALTAAYRAALCVIVPNIEPASGEFEGFGLIAAEAAAAGGLVLAAECGGLMEAVVDGETGFLLPTAEPDPWRMRIMEVAAWPAAARSTFLAGAMATARAHYAWPRVAEDVVEIYRQALAIDNSRRSFGKFV